MEVLHFCGSCFSLHRCNSTFLFVFPRLTFTQTWHISCEGDLRLNLRGDCQRCLLPTEILSFQRGPCGLQQQCWWGSQNYRDASEAKARRALSKQVYSAFLMKTSQGSDSTDLHNEVLLECGVWEWEWSEEFRGEVRTSEWDTWVGVSSWFNASRSQVWELRWSRSKAYSSFERSEQERKAGIRGDQSQVIGRTGSWGSGRGNAEKLRRKSGKTTCRWIMPI